VLPAVINDILVGMLARRGFTEADEFDEESGEYVSVWQRDADAT
jgi:hypothetical protein